MRKYLTILMLGLSALGAGEWRASAVIVRGGTRLCAVCDRPFAHGSGFSPRLESRVDPEPVVAVVIAVEDDLFPNRRPWTVATVAREGWDVPTTFEFCERCDARYEARKKEVSSSPEAWNELLRRFRKKYGAEEKPNQSSEPTPTSGTSAAEQPLVPAAVVAHL